MTKFTNYTKEQIAIDRLKMFEPPEGYYLAFSGGKDSQVLYHLAIQAGVKFDAHYNITSVDPPELVRFIRENYPDVKFETPDLSMRNLIIKKGFPPTRRGRYCCEVLKERGGVGRSVLVGVRSAESARRSNYSMIGHCSQEGKRKRIIRPIIDFTIKDVWDYLLRNEIEYCSLYDQGFKRLGCVGCPMASVKNRRKEFDRYPGVKKMYLGAFEKMLETRKQKGLKTSWKTASEVMQWWMSQ